MSSRPKTLSKKIGLFISFSVKPYVLGSSAGYYTTGCCNTFVGQAAGGGVTGGNENVLIGKQAGDPGTSNDLTTGSNNIIIGTFAEASAATVSNEITLGNASITKFRIPGLNSFQIDDSGVIGGTASVASSATGVRNITASTSAPSGGSDGDIWIKYTA